MNEIVIGSRFGRLTVINPKSNKTKRGRWQHLCSCECGAIKNVLYASLSSGVTKSCGCLSKDKATTHGLSRTPGYKSWLSMLRRCNNPKSANYVYYGAAGIRVEDPRWLDVRNFFEDMGIRPEGTSLDRIDGSKGYSKNNCRWANYSTQNLNRKTFKNNKTGHKNISYSEKRGTYVVAVHGGDKARYVGSYPKLEGAVAARDKAIAAYSGVS